MQEQITSVEYDSRKVKPGSTFVCISGEKLDGHNYMMAAAKAGAAKIVIERGYENQAAELQKEYPNLIIETVPNTRAALAWLSAKFYGNPSEKLSIIGITGTNGKTTITHLIQNIIGDYCALLGTMGLKTNPAAPYMDMGNTTPQSAEIQKILADLVASKHSHLTMEVSSHALDQHRTDQIKFSTAVVTNLTQDHLDYHKTMDRYLEAKAKIFLQTSKNAILNADDSYYPQFLAAAEKAGLKIISYGLRGHCERSEAIHNSNKWIASSPTTPCNSKNEPDGSFLRSHSERINFTHTDLDITAANMSFNHLGLNFDLVIPTTSKLASNSIPERTRFNLKLNGLFNVYNSLAAIAACLVEGISLNQIKAKLEATEPISGRFETIKTDKSPLCIVDYAHSPDGLDNVLRGARELLRVTGSQGKLITVFGCGGDRDITKRPKMGRIAHELSDFIYVTSDNPRSEEPQQIIADILTGIPDLGRINVVPDRATAIREAIARANSEDIVVIAGKGHEDYQILKDKTIHFDDREQVRAVIGLST